MMARRSVGVICTVAAALCVAAASAVAQAPIIDAGQPVGRSGSSSKNSPASAPASNNSPTGTLYLQLQSLQQEVMDLRGIIEEQRHQLDTLRQQSLDRYTDLDRRLSQGGAAVAVASQPDANAVPADSNAVPASEGAASSAAAPVPAVAAPVNAGMQTAKPEEYEAYQKAYAKMKGQDFAGAIKAFNSFIETYPGSTLTGNAYYWLGKAYLQPSQDLAKAQQAFTKVVGDHPQHTKAPDALYELGKIYYLKGDKAKAKSSLQQVIDNYGTSGSTAPQLAKQFLDQNFRK